MITGAGGQLGHDCLRVFGKTHQVTALGHQELDITRRARVHETVGKISPDLIINCAAHTGVDACETEAELARERNVSGPRYLAQSADRHAYGQRIAQSQNQRHIPGQS
jgi:dTDP-4-dehydrorhamnose reductase